MRPPTDLTGSIDNATGKTRYVDTKQAVTTVSTHLWQAVAPARLDYDHTKHNNSQRKQVEGKR